MKRLDIRNFLLISVILHLILVPTLGIVLPTSEKPEPQKISIRLIKPQNQTIEEFIAGRILELKESKKKEKSENAKILANIDSRSGSPKKENNKIDLNKETVIPFKKVLPPEKMLDVAKKIKEPKPKTVKAENVRKKQKPARMAKVANQKTVKKKDHFSMDPISKLGELETPKPNKNRFVKKPSQKSKKSETSKKAREEKPRPIGSDQWASIDPVVSIKSKNSNRESHSGQVEEISLNTKEFKYFDYFQAIKRSMERNWSYPQQALVDGDQGIVVVRLSLLESGDLIRVRIEHSSGSHALDYGAIEAVQSSAPFSPFPKTIRNSRLDIIANFVYQSGYRPIYSQ